MGTVLHKFELHIFDESGFENYSEKYTEFVESTPEKATPEVRIRDTLKTLVLSFDLLEDADTFAIGLELLDYEIYEQLTWRVKSVVLEGFK